MTNGHQSELELSTLASQLISQTMDGVLSSLLCQQQKASAMAEAVELSLAEFQRLHLAPEQLDDELISLFGRADGQPALSRVATGQAYRPARRRVPERPAIAALTGVGFDQADYSWAESGYFISPTGAAKVRDAVGLALAGRLQRQLRQMLQQGLPQVQVDSGRIAIKLSARMEQPGPTAGELAPRLLVRPLSPSGPELLGKRANVVSELEIRFHTTVQGK